MKSAPSPLEGNVHLYPQENQWVRLKSSKSCRKSVSVYPEAQDAERRDDPTSLCSVPQRSPDTADAGVEPGDREGVIRRCLRIVMATTSPAITTGRPSLCS